MTVLNLTSLRDLSSKDETSIMIRKTLLSDVDSNSMELMTFFFFFCLFRDLIKKFLVIDRARRLGNMKVSQLNSRSLSFSHTAAPFNFFYESVRIRPKNRILFPEPAWTRPWFMILEQYFPNHCSNRLIKLNIRMLLKKEDTDNSLAFLIQGQRDSKMQTVNNDWTFQCLPWGREYTLIHKAWL